MKKIFAIIVAAFIITAISVDAKTASQLRVYINPGHGGWCGDCRPQNIHREVNGADKICYATSGDTTAFFESNTNLWKCLAMRDKFESYGLKYNHAYTARNMSQSIAMSRIKTGPYPINANDHTYNLNLSTICAEANANNFDMFISVHSNANTDPHGVNYTSFFFRGRSYAGGDLVSGSRNMCRTTWGHLYGMTFQKWTARHSNADNVGVLGDITFYQGGKAGSTGYLGALRHNVPGYLAEGYFHTYQPARHRYMQQAVCRNEGVLYARGAAEYFGISNETTGDICGFVRSQTETFSGKYYTTYDSYSGVNLSIDKYKGINGATVKLLNSAGTVLKTFTTDNHYNGAFAFTGIAPGTYTVQISKTGYKTTTSSVTVTAKKTVYPELRLALGSDAPTNALKSAPLNNLVEKWNFSVAKGTAVRADYDATKIRNFCYQNGKLYCVYNHTDILVLNAQTGAKLGVLDKGTIVAGGTLALCDVKCIDGKIIACNLASASNSESVRIYAWDSDNAPAQCIMTTDNLRGCTCIGDCMEVSGTWDGDMYLTFCNDNGSTATQIIDYHRNSKGEWDTKVYPVMNPALTGRLGTQNTTRAYRRSGGFWVDGFNVYPTWCALNSAGQAVATYCMPLNQEWGTGFVEFQWLNDKYCAAMIFANKTSNSAENFYGGRVRFTVNNVGYTTPITVADYPSAGLGNVKNGNATTGCFVNTDSKTYVELWVNSTTQGLCYYTYGTPPTHPVSAITLPNTMKSSPLNNMVEKWNMSAAKGNNAQDGFDTKLIRNFAYNKGKLYCVYNHSDILVLNAQTGAKLGVLDKGGVVDGGTLTLCDVKVIDDVVIACNLAIAEAGEELRFYAWENDNAPAKLIKTVSNLRGCSRLGDCMELRGSYTGDMYLTFCNDNGAETQIVDFYRKNGKDWNADVYKVLNPSGSARLGSGFNSRAYKRDNGFWIDGYNCFPSFCQFIDANTLQAQYCLPLNQSWGTGFVEFQWLNDKYCATMIFADKTDDTSMNCTGGRVRFTVNNEREYQQPILVKDYPSAGLGPNKNGNTTGSSYVNTDSKTYVELWVQSTNQGLCYYTYGTPPAQNPSAIVPPVADPTISASPTSIELTCEEKHSTTATFTVFGRYLTNDITLSITGNDAARFSLDKTTISKSAISTEVNVTFASETHGSYAATINLASVGATTVTIPVTATATARTEFRDNIDQLEEVWNYSGTKGTDGQQDWLVLDANLPYTRDIHVVDGKLYVVNSKPWTNGSAIKIVDATTGVETGELNVSPIPTSGSRVPIGGITDLGGQILACNSALSTHTLKVYRWKNDSAEPDVVIEDATHGGITVGDQINASGDLTKGYVWVSNGQKVLRYDVNNGVFSQTPVEITLSNGKLSSNGSVDICPMADGSFWVVGTTNTPMLYDAEGNCMGTLSYETEYANNSRTEGTAMSVIDFGDKQYMAATTYIVNPQTSGAVVLIDISGSVSARARVASDKIEGTFVGMYPESGLGTTRNTQYQTAVTVSTTNDGKTLNVWGAIPFQGIAYYKFDGEATTSSIEHVSVSPCAPTIITWGNEITASAGSTIEVYTTSGALVARSTTGSVDKSQLPVGIYVIRAYSPDGRSAVKKVALTR